MRFIEIKIINCIDPQNWLINCLDPVLLEQTRPGDAKHKINLIWPYQYFCPGQGHSPGIYVTCRASAVNWNDLPIGILDNMSNKLSSWNDAIKIACADLQIQLILFLASTQRRLWLFVETSEKKIY